MSTQLGEHQFEENSAEFGTFFSVPFLDQRLRSLAAFATCELAGEFQAQ